MLLKLMFCEFAPTYQHLTDMFSPAVTTHNIHYVSFTRCMNGNILFNWTCNEVIGWYIDLGAKSMLLRQEYTFGRLCKLKSKHGNEAPLKFYPSWQCALCNIDPTTEYRGSTFYARKCPCICVFITTWYVGLCVLPAISLRPGMLRFTYSSV